jgi:glycosyltransferase involved in cell wall biosynthesis
MSLNSLSIIIPTRDRAASLKETLRAIDETALPADLAGEVLVVDNGSRDSTRRLVRQAKVWGRPPLYLYEPRLGLSSARNAGMAVARGEILLWTDDDVRPGRTWIEAMCRPIREGRADAVAGRVKLPECLERPWLRPWHRVCLAVDSPTAGDFDLVGANMAFARRVLEEVPAFDVEIGPGALGSGDDSFFSRQLVAAGFRLVAADQDSTAVHHCGADRLTRSGLAEVLLAQGRSQAYVDYHWKHRSAWFPTFRGGKSMLGLCVPHILRRLLGDRDSVIGRREARWLWRWSYYRQMLIESRRPRQYEQFGLKKLAVSCPLGCGLSPAEADRGAVQIGRKHAA